MSGIEDIFPNHKVCAIWHLLNAPFPNSLSQKTNRMFGLDCQKSCLWEQYQHKFKL